MNPTFILGVPRSGTTLLRVLLDSHADIAGAPETAWITGGYGERSLLELVNYLCTNEIGPVENLSGVDEGVVINASKRFLETIFESYLDSRGKKHLVLKTPDDIRNVEFLCALFPEARFIHIHRDGWDVACSTVEKKGDFFGDVLPGYGELDIRNALKRWYDWDSKVRNLLSHDKDKYLNISYENLVLDPESVLKSVQEFVGVPYDRKVINYANSTHEYPDWEAGSSDVKTRSELESGSIGRWRGEIPEALWGEIDKKYGHYLGLLGYAACNCCDNDGLSISSCMSSAGSPGPRFNLKGQAEEYFGEHRSGWAYAVKSLVSAHDERAVYLNTFVEKTFVWGASAPCVIEEPWIGIIHVPPRVPEWFLANQSNAALFAGEAWQRSVENCRGLFTLSEYHKRNLQDSLDLPVESLLHPTEEPALKWTPEAFRKNKNRAIVQVGWWLRVMHAIFELPDCGMDKIFLRARNDIGPIFQVEREIRKKQGLFRTSMYDTARVVDTLDSGEYDRLLSENIVFLNLYDASANNAVIECIVRNTPILVNPIEAVTEYLGRDYPLYYETLREAAEKAADVSLIESAYEYLRNLPIKSRLTGEYFLKSIQNSRILRSGARCNGEEKRRTGNVDTGLVLVSSRERAMEHIRRGELCFEQGKIDQAREEFEQALSVDKGCADAYNNLGVLLWHDGNVVEALRCCADGLAVDRDHGELTANTCKILEATGNYKDAIDLCDGYLARNPGDGLISKIGEELRLVAEGEGGITVASTEGEVQRVSGVDLSNMDSDVGVIELGLSHTVSVAAGSLPSISVVIPSLNHGQFIEQTIRSVLDQGYPNLELVVMDGGSTDGTLEIIRKYSDRIAYWQSRKDGGQYHAVQEGFRHTTGHIMTWINSDDCLCPDALMNVATVFSHLPDVEWITGRPAVMNEAGRVVWRCSPLPVYSRDYYLRGKYDFPRYIQQEGTFWRRSLWEKAGARMDTSLAMAGDLELWMRFFRHARLHTVNVSLGYFRQHDAQKTATGLERYRMEARKALGKEQRRYQKRKDGVTGKAPVIFVGHNGAASTKWAGSDGRSDTGAGENVQGILVSAIVSTYNSVKFMRGCLDDLLEQTLAERLEIIVIDSGSEEDEASVVREYQKHHDNIRYLRTERESIYAAWNRAIRMARGRYITNANTDDRHRRDALERLAVVLDADPEVALVYADSKVTCDENATFDTAHVEGCFRWPEFDARNLFSVCYVGPHPMWRKSLHERHGYFDEAFKVAGDYEFWLRIVPYETFRHVPETLGLYLSSPDSVEHACADVGFRETEIARRRNWPPEWGERPAPRGGYLVRRTDEVMENRNPSNTGPLVSIVMPTKDRPELLGRALDSVIDQGYSNWELLVVNDGGVSVRSVVEGRDPRDRIRLLELDDSRGQAGARNLALELARGDIVCYLDDDDLYLPHHLETVVRALADGNREFVYTDAVVVMEDSHGELVGDGDPHNPYAHSHYSRERLLVRNYIPINTWAHRRDALRHVGNFDASLACYEDWEFLLRFSRHCDFHHVSRTTVEVHHRFDRVDNVTRRHLGDTLDAYRTIYMRHDQGVDDRLREERSEVLEKLEENAGGGAAGLLEEPAGAPDESGVLGDGDIQSMVRRMQRGWDQHPAFHLVVIHVPGMEEALADTLDSLGSQIYGGWGLSVVSTGECPDSTFLEAANLEWLQVEGGLINAVNRVISDSAADWVALLEAGDILAPHFLYHCVEYVHQFPETRLLYFDEDRRAPDGRYHDPLFKPDFNRELLRSMPYMGHCLMVRRKALLDAGGYATEEGVAAYDLALRMSEGAGSQEIGHIPLLLLHRQDRFMRRRDEQAVVEARRHALAAHLERCGLEAEADNSILFGGYRVTAKPSFAPPVEIVVVVETMSTDKLSLCIGNLLEKTDYPDFRVRVLLGSGVSAAGLDDARLAISRYEPEAGPWRVINRLVGESECEYLVVMTPQAVVVQAEWLRRLVGHCQESDVAAVAPRLVSGDGRLLNGGVVVGGGALGVGAILHTGIGLDEPGYMGRALVAQDLGAVSCTCVLVRRAAFEAVQGFPLDKQVDLYRSVEFCLRLSEQGGRIIWTPHATLLYASEATPQNDSEALQRRCEEEAGQIHRRWLPRLARDPAYNPNLRLSDANFQAEPEFLAPWRRTAFDGLRVTAYGTGAYGSWQYRVAQPMRRLHREAAASTLVLPFSRSIRLPSVAELERLESDVLLMHNAVHDQTLDALAAYKRVNGSFLVFGQDDLVTDLPAKNPLSRTIYRDMKKRLRKSLTIADRLVVTTAPLAEALSDLAEDIVVVPNALDEDIWGGLESLRGVGRKPRVGWAGAQQHQGDLELLEAVVRELAGEVEWVFFGMCPRVLRPYVKEVHAPVSFRDYPRALAGLNLDLALAPLEHNRFNQCKSNLRILEYGMLGWPVVATDIEPYRGAPVCRVPNQPRAWIKAIRERIHDLPEAAREGDRLRSWVRDGWLLHQHLDQWLAALQANAATEPAGRQARQRNLAG